jgi:short-subunit dehydrogenase
LILKQKKMNVNSKTALLTGAGSGIGRAIALSLAKRNCHLALVDINSEGLKETAAQVSKFGINVSEHILDVRDKASINALPAAINEIHGGIDILINNAGIAAAGTFLEMSEEVFDQVIDVNFKAMVVITRVFLPQLLDRKEARIVNISSVYGLIAPAEQTAYSASKFAVRGFSNALRHELENTNVGVTVVHPGGVATNIARNALISEKLNGQEFTAKLAEQEKMLTMLPEKAGELIVKAIEGNKARLLVGADARLVSLIERVIPVHYWKILQSLVKLKGV